MDPDEVAHYEELAHRWWDTDGPLWPLHKLNTFRVGYIREHLSHTFVANPAAEHPLKGQRLVDIGAGGGNPERVQRGARRARPGDRHHPRRGLP